MWVYTKSEPGLYTVGFFYPVGIDRGEWEAIEDFNSEHEARMLVNYLNGGSVTKIYKGEPLPPGDLMKPD